MTMGEGQTLLNLNEKYLQNYFLDFAKCAAAIATNVTASKNIVQTITIYQRVLSTVPVCVKKF